MEIAHRIFIGDHEYISPSGFTLRIVSGYLPHIYNEGIPWPITSNPVEYYRSNGAFPANFRPTPGKRYCEVGAGLGGYVEWLDDQLGPDNQNPILVIDPAPFREIRGLLNASLADIELFRAARKSLDVLMTRANLLLNPARVTLISAMVEDVP